MDSSWWRAKEEMDQEQQAFIKLPATGRYMLQGPPGSGKTNLLLLRAQYIAASGSKNVLIISFTNALAEFMRVGVAEKGFIEPHQIRTYHSWASEHVRQYLGKNIVEKGAPFDEKARRRALGLIKDANARLTVSKPYQSIFVDEAQDFGADELKALLSLSDNICVCGDSQQGIYERDGLSIASTMSLEHYSLKKHYRIGPKIAAVADKLIPPAKPELGLEATCNYDSKARGVSSAKMYPLPDRDEQFQRMHDLLKVQLDAFEGDSIGVLCGKRETLRELTERFSASDLSDKVCIHNDDGAGFAGKHPIHVLTMHSSKGTEFRAVHLFGVEDLKGYGLNGRKLSYTAVTRAKTSLSAYRTGPTNAPLEAAFAEPAHVELDDLF